MHIFDKCINNDDNVSINRCTINNGGCSTVDFIFDSTRLTLPTLVLLLVLIKKGDVSIVVLSTMMSFAVLFVALFIFVTVSFSSGIYKSLIWCGDDEWPITQCNAACIILTKHFLASECGQLIVWCGGGECQKIGKFAKFKLKNSEK